MPRGSHARERGNRPPPAAAPRVIGIPLPDVEVDRASGRNDVPPNALRANEPIAPVGNRNVRALRGSHRGDIRLHLAAATLAPHDQPDLGSGAAPSVIGGPR